MKTYKGFTRYNLAITLAMIAAVMLLLLAESGVAFAHARLKSSSILPDSVVTTAPTSLTLTFDEETSPTQTKLSVTDANNKVVDKGDLKVDGDKATVSLNALANGKYTVTFRSLTEDDGGVVNGLFNFTVSTGGAATAGNLGGASQEELTIPVTAPNTGNGGASKTSDDLSFTLIGMLGAIAFLSGAVVLVSRRHRA